MPSVEAAGRGGGGAGPRRRARFRAPSLRGDGLGRRLQPGFRLATRGRMGLLDLNLKFMNHVSLTSHKRILELSYCSG